MRRVRCACCVHATPASTANVTHGCCSAGCAADLVAAQRTAARRPSTGDDDDAGDDEEEEEEEDDDDAGPNGGYWDDDGDGDGGAGEHEEEQEEEDEEDEEEEDEDDGDDGGEGEGEAAAPGERRRWRELADEPLYVDARLTVKQLCFLAAKHKCDVQQSNASFNGWLRLQSASMPWPNLCPHDLRTVRLVLGVKDHRCFLRHVCLGPPDGRGPSPGCGLFPRVDKKHWSLDITCAACGTSCFVEVTDVHGHRQLQPRYPEAYYLGLKNSLRDLFSSASWCHERRTPRADMDHTHWGGEYFKRVDATLGGALFDLDNDAYEVGFDWVQPFKWNDKLELGVVTLRAMGLGTESRGRDTFVKELLLIVTLDKPKWLLPYLSEMHDEFDVLESSGFTVYDSWLKREITHRGWLLLAVGDAPVVSLYMNAWGHTSIRGCWRCFFCALHATKLGGTGGVFFTGYTGPVEQQLGLFKYSVGDNHTLVLKRCQANAITAFAAQRTTHDLLVAMSNDAEAEIAAGKRESSTPCIKGRSAFWRREHFDLRFGVQIPLFHCMLFGVAKTFLKLVLPKKPLFTKPWVIAADKRAECTRRASLFDSPHDVGRKYRDVVKHLGGWTMEDFGFFLGTAGLFVLRDAWPHGDNSPYYRIFVLLSRAYHILFEGTKVCTAAAIDEAKACLEECAKLCQTHLPVEMCTYNLHTLVCHVLEACAQTGSAGAATELYVERAIRRIVRCTRARATKNVGAFLMNESLLSSCVTRLSETIKLTLDDLAPSRRPAVLLSRVAGATMVEEPRADGDYFSTVGKRDYLVGPDGAAQRALLNEWFARSEPTINFATLGDDDFVCHRFGTVVRAGVEVHSRAYTRVQSRVSWHVAIDFVGQGLHFGEVLWFWRVAVTTAQGEQVFRLARLKLYHRVTAATAERPWGVVDPTTAYSRDVSTRVCDVRSIMRKVVLGRLTDTRAMAMFFHKN